MTAVKAVVTIAVLSALFMSVGITVGVVSEKRQAAWKANHCRYTGATQAEPCWTCDDGVERCPAWPASFSGAEK